MTKFLRNPAVKAVLAVLCIISLTAAVFSGCFVVAMLVVGEFDGTGSLGDYMLENQLAQDCHKIMYDYFDPSEPTEPWRSYYDGGIYTGEDSNFRYNVVESDTGYSVLATVEGGEDILMRREFSHMFEVSGPVPAEDRYVIAEAMFTCGGNTYLYNEEADYFYPVYDENVLQYLSPVSVGDDVFHLGFTYLGSESPAAEIDTPAPVEMPAESTPIPTEAPIVEDVVVATQVDEKIAVASTYPPYMNQSHYDYDGEGFFRSERGTEYVSEMREFTIIGYVLYDLADNDEYARIYELTTFLSLNRQDLVALFALTAILGLMLLIILLCNVGKVNGKDEPVVSLLFKLPSDIVLVAAFFAVGIGANLSYYVSNIGSYYAELVATVLLVLAIVTVVVYTLLMLCVRVRTHTLISGSIICWCWRLLKKYSRKLINLGGRLIRYIPLVWKVAVCYIAICVVEMFALAMGGCDEGTAFFWFFESVVLGALVLYVTLAFRRLMRGADNIAAGNYTAKISEDHLVLDFKDAAYTLNNIQGGMNAAVESRMKSERLKTELITNVSHDIKTPLTSIVSYVDLLKQEPAGSETAKEYIEVLDRQSARLKKLVEDLVEASKASTGNIAVHAESMDLSVVLGQALGEYSERLALQGLTPVVKTPEGPVMVSADGRLLWRVFDNLLGNVVKYAMPGTRVYVTLTSDSHAIVTFRNISREPLDVSADELMERFVRGDSSRSTEGSGLGLSIAKSLTESMGGEFILSVDGDLFKAAVILPLLPASEAETE